MPSLDAILRPRSVAVVGASRRPHTIGWNILDNLLRHDFQGPVYPVNPAARAVHAIPAYASVANVPGPIDLAVVVVPKDHVLDVARECARAGVRGLVVISAGFKEVGGAGVERERELVAIARGAGMRLVGPNCLGVVNTDPAVSLNATFAPMMPPPGPVAFISQSGAMGVSILDHACRLGLGISTFVSAGNKADVSSNDLLAYWRDDPRTRVVLMYLEDFGNPRHFVDTARSITRTKPVCIVKSGRTGAGARAAASHTGALAGTALATDALIAQAGAIPVSSVAALFELALAFATQPLPRGPRVAIVTNAGGPGIIAADAAEAHGLEVPALAEKTQARLAASLPEEASVGNPVDMIASATADSYDRALDAVLDDPGVDAAVAAFVPPLGIQARDVAAAIARAAREHEDKPVLAVLMGQEGSPAGVEELRHAGVPAYLFPEPAARALAALWRQRRIAERPQGRPVALEGDDDAVAAILDRTLASGRAMASEPDALALLEAGGLPVLPWRFVAAEGDGHHAWPERCAEVAAELGLPVAMKAVSRHVVHKTDVGGVALGLSTPDEVARAVASMSARVAASIGERDGPALDGVLLQRMGPEGTETIVGMTRVPRVGPLVMFGLGGIFVEVLQDVVLRLAPLLDTDAEEMVRGVRLHRLLEGVRGRPPCDLDAIQQAILRVARLAVLHPRIVEMDVNPLLAMPHGVVAIDARVRVEEPGT